MFNENAWKTPEFGASRDIDSEILDESTDNENLSD